MKAAVGWQYNPTMCRCLQCDDEADVAAMWHDVWEESATSGGAGLRLHVKEITQARKKQVFVTDPLQRRVVWTALAV